jgi:regulator of microtubule dynamics protein 3
MIMKRLLQKYTLCMLLCVMANSVTAVAGAGTEVLLKKAAELMSNYKDSEALTLYEQVLLTEPENYTALCKASLLNFRIGDRVSDESSKLEYFTKAKQFAQKAYVLKPTHADANYVMALSVGSLAMISGPKKRLAGINQVKTFIDTAIENDPQHAGAWHLLGRWHFKMANLNLAEVAASKMFFGGLYEPASNEEAVTAIRTAISFNSNNIQYYYDLATIYQELKNKDACHEALEQAVALEVSTREELEISRKCKLLLAQITK